MGMTWGSRDLYIRMNDQDDQQREEAGVISWRPDGGRRKKKLCNKIREKK